MSESAKLHQLTFSGQTAVTLGSQQRQCHVDTGKGVPGGKHMIDRGRSAFFGRFAGQIGEPGGTVDGVVHCRASIRVTEQVNHNQILPVLAQGVVAHPAFRGGEVSREHAITITRGGDKITYNLLAFGLPGVDGKRALAFVESRPIEAFTTIGDWPAFSIDAATNRIKTYHVGSQLAQRHAT